MRERFDAKTSEELGKWYDMAFSKGNLKMKGNFYPKMLAWINLPSDNSKKLLDIACGSGFLLKEAEKQVDTYGIDISHVAIKEAEKIAKNSNIKVGTAEKLPYKDNFFDYVICLGSLEHFINMEKGLSEMRRVMKPNAIANILVPNSDYLIFKFIGQPPLYQINERWMNQQEWASIIKKYLKIKEIKKYNTRWYFKWIPTKYCCHFAFICEKVI